MPQTAEPWRGSINRPDAIYIVKAGDTLSKIATTFYNNATAIDIQRIADANKLGPNDIIKVGQRLMIPGGGSLDPKGSEDSPDLTERKDQTVVAQVQPGFRALSLDDWRVWAGAGVIALALYMLARRK